MFLYSNSWFKIAFAVSVTTLVALSARPAAAQLTLDGTAYYVHTDATLSSNIFGKEVLVGKTDESHFDTIPGSITLDIINGGATSNSGGTTYPDGRYYSGVIAFGNHQVNVSGSTAFVYEVTSYDSSIINASDGRIINEILGRNDSTVNVSNLAQVASLYGDGNGTFNMTGGGVGYINGYGTTHFNISGGNVTGIGGLGSTAIAGHITSTISVSGSANVYGDIVGINQTTINVSGGSVHGNIKPGETSIVNATGGTIDAITGYFHSTVNVSGGIESEVKGIEHSTVNVSGAANITSLIGLDDTIINVSGGNITDIFGSGNSVFNLSGGTISASTIYQREDTASFDFTGLGITYSGAMSGVNPFGENGVFYNVTWTRADNSVLHTRYFDRDGSLSDTVVQGAKFNGNPISVTVTVPESNTLPLLTRILS